MGDWLLVVAGAVLGCAMNVVVDHYWYNLRHRRGTDERK